MSSKTKNNANVAIVIVTFNRSALLQRCVDALLAQRDFLRTIFVIDNASTDETESLFTEQGRYVDEACVTYVKMPTNIGSGGGFYKGVELSFGDHDYAILMDDDGYSDAKMIENLVAASIKSDLHFANALVIDETDHDILAFKLARQSKVEVAKELADDNIYLGGVNPFNGTLISRQLYDKIGNIKKEMFIWGDEVEYRLRTQNAGFEIGTVTNAHHYHPTTKTYRQDVFGIKIEEKKGNISHVFYRNQAYKIATYENKKNLMWFFLRYSLHMIFNKRSFTMLRRFWAYAIDGAKNRYSLPALLKDTK